MPEQQETPAADQQSKTVDVEGQYRQADDTLKTIGTMGPHTVKASMLQVVDRRFHRRMLLAHGNKNLFIFTNDVGLAQPALPRQYVVVQQLIKPKAIRGAVETAVKTAGLEACGKVNKFGIPY